MNLEGKMYGMILFMFWKLYRIECYTQYMNLVQNTPVGKLGRAYG